MFPKAAPTQFVSENKMNEIKTVEEIDAAIEALNSERKNMLEAKKDSDLELVKKLCKQHGFTATQLRSALKLKGKSTRTPANKTAVKKTVVNKTVKPK